MALLLRYNTLVYLTVLLSCPFYIQNIVSHKKCVFYDDFLGLYSVFMRCNSPHLLLYNLFKLDYMGHIDEGKVQSVLLESKL